MAGSYVSCFSCCLALLRPSFKIHTQIFIQDFFCLCNISDKGALVVGCDGLFLFFREGTSGMAVKLKYNLQTTITDNKYIYGCIRQSALR